MSFDTTTTPAADANTLLTDYTRLRDNDKSLAGAGQEHDFGGSLDKFVEDTVAADLPDSWEKEIDGTELAGRSVIFEIVANAELSSAVTVTIDLFNVTDAGAVASSAVAIALTSTTRQWAKSGALTLPTALKRYKARIKGSVGAGNKVAGRARVVIR